MSFGYKHVQNDFKAFMAHCLKLSEAFHLLEFVQTENKISAPQTENKPDCHGTSSIQKKEKGKTVAPSQVPICLFEPHYYRGIRRLLKDCKDCP